MHEDSGLGSLACSQSSDTSPVGGGGIGGSGNNAENRRDIMHAYTDNVDGSVQVQNSPPRVFTVVYLGEYVLDRRYTECILPWVMAAVRRRDSGRVVHMSVEATTLRAAVRTSTGLIRGAGSGYAPTTFMFEHKLRTIAKLSRTVLDPRCFSYLTRTASDKPFACHVFHMANESLVSCHVWS